MIIIITESQLKKIRLEQTLFGNRLEDVYSTPEGAKKMQDFYGDIVNGLISLRSRNKLLFDTIVQYGLWLIPYGGPYFSAAYGTAVAIHELKKGNTAEGIIGLITSPLALNKTLVVLGALGESSANYFKWLTAINKSGITVLISQGKQAFLNWGIKQFGSQFSSFAQKFLDLTDNPKKMEEILNYAKSEIEKLYKEKKAKLLANVKTDAEKYKNNIPASSTYVSPKQKPVKI